MVQLQLLHRGCGGVVCGACSLVVQLQAGDTVAPTVESVVHLQL